MADFNQYCGLLGPVSQCMGRVHTRCAINPSNLASHDLATDLAGYLPHNCHATQSKSIPRVPIDIFGEVDMTRYGTHNTGTGTSELRDMSGTRSKSDHQNTDAPLAQKRAAFETQIYTSSRGTEDRVSRASSTGGSQELIIRKETTWNVVTS
jgi:hypothetical protein